MPIDPKGTSPHPVAEPPQRKVHNMKCRREGCDSITAYQTPIPNGALRRYECTKCHFIWALNVGGHIDI